MPLLYVSTAKFTLRPFKTSDATFLRRNIQAEEIFEHTLQIPRPYRLRHAKEHIAKNLRQYRMTKPANIGFVIEVKNEAAGAIGATFRGPTAEVGYWLAKKHWGQGMMTEVIAIFSDYLFSTYTLKTLTGRVFDHNLASARVLEKNGFKRFRRLVKGEQKNGEWISVIEYKKARPK